MPEFRRRDGSVNRCTAKEWVRSYHKDAVSRWGEPVRVTTYDGIMEQVLGRPAEVLGEGDTAQKAWMDAARKLEARLAKGGYN